MRCGCVLRDKPVFAGHVWTAAEKTPSPQQPWRACVRGHAACPRSKALLLHGVVKARPCAAFPLLPLGLTGRHLSSAMCSQRLQECGSRRKCWRPGTTRRLQRRPGCRRPRRQRRAEGEADAHPPAPYRSPARRRSSPGLL